MQNQILDATAPVSNLTFSYLWLPYVIAGVAILALIYLYLENKKLKAGKEHYKSRAHKFDIELQQKAQVIMTLTNQKTQLEKELADSELDRKSLEDRLKSLEMKKVQPVQPKAAPQSPTPIAPVAAAPVVKEKAVPKPVVQPQAPKPPAAKVKYAHYADMGDGFSNAELLDKPDSETIFEITIASNNNTGEYKVTSNPDGQRYALSNAQYFLGKTCQYDSFPSGNNAVIKTEKSGTVKLNGGKWVIVNPARISFG